MTQFVVLAPELDTAHRRMMRAMLQQMKLAYVVVEDWESAAPVTHVLSVGRAALDDRAGADRKRRHRRPRAGRRARVGAPDSVVERNGERIDRRVLLERRRVGDGARRRAIGRQWRHVRFVGLECEFRQRRHQKQRGQRRQVALQIGQAAVARAVQRRQRRLYRDPRTWCTDSGVVPLRNEAGELQRVRCVLGTIDD